MWQLHVLNVKIKHVIIFMPDLKELETLFFHFFDFIFEIYLIIYLSNFYFVLKHDRVMQ